MAQTLVATAISEQCRWYLISNDQNNRFTDALVENDSAQEVRFRVVYQRTPTQRQVWPLDGSLETVMSGEHKNYALSGQFGNVNVNQVSVDTFD